MLDGCLIVSLFLLLRYTISVHDDYFNKDNPPLLSPAAKRTATPPTTKDTKVPFSAAITAPPPSPIALPPQELAARGLDSFMMLLFPHKMMDEPYYVDMFDFVIEEDKNRC